MTPLIPAKAGIQGGTLSPHPGCASRPGSGWAASGRRAVARWQVLALSPHAERAPRVGSGRAASGRRAVARWCVFSDGLWSYPRRFPQTPLIPAKAGIHRACRSSLTPARRSGILSPHAGCASRPGSGWAASGRRTVVRWWGGSGGLSVRPRRFPQTPLIPAKAGIQGHGAWHLRHANFAATVVLVAWHPGRPGRPQRPVPAVPQGAAPNPGFRHPEPVADLAQRPLARLERGLRRRPVRSEGARGLVHDADVPCGSKRKRRAEARLVEFVFRSRELASLAAARARPDRPADGRPLVGAVRLGLSWFSESQPRFPLTRARSARRRAGAA